MSDTTNSQSIRLERILTIAIVIIMTIAIGFALSVLKTILMPFIVAILLAYIFSPLIEKLASFKIPRSLTIVILFILIFIVATWLGSFLFKNINEFIGDWPQLQSQLESNLNTLTSKLNLNKQDVVQFLTNIPIGQSVSTVITTSFTFLGNILITLLFMVFILFSVHTIPEKIHRAFPANQAEKITKIIKNINQQVQKYMLIKTFISFLTGLSVYFILTLLSVKFAFLWGAIAFFFNYIPNIGSVLAAIPPVLTAFLQFDITKALIVLLVFGAIQFFLGNIVEPLVIGKKLNLSPIVVLLALLFWGWLWGFVGAIISVPLMAIIKIVFSNIDGLKPIAVLMSEK